MKYEYLPRIIKNFLIKDIFVITIAAIMDTAIKPIASIVCPYVNGAKNVVAVAITT